jgi:hypothetical protein
VAHRFDDLNFTAARQISADGVRRYLVWTRRGSAVACHLYETTSSAEAIRLARQELEMAERWMASI